MMFRPNRLVTSVLLSSFLSTFALAQDGCFNSTNAIIEAQMSSPGPMEIIVCPDTTINIGVPAPDMSGMEGGEWPLMALGPDISIKCGETGERSNNCVINAPFMHVMTFPDLPQLGLSGMTADNLLISGFTFTGDGVAVGELHPSSVILNSPGFNQTINDCVWKDMSSGLYIMVREVAEMTQDPALPDLSLEVTLQNSEFNNVVYNSYIVESHKQAVTVRNNLFSNVMYENSYCNCTSAAIISVDTGFVATAYSMSEAYLTVENNCFVNVEVGDILVLAAGDGDYQVELVHMNNYVDGFTYLFPNETNYCDGGLGVSTTKDGLLEECRALSDVSTCQIEGLDVGVSADTQLVDAETTDEEIPLVTGTDNTGEEPAVNGTDTTMEEPAVNGTDATMGEPTEIEVEEPTEIDVLASSGNEAETDGEEPTSSRETEEATTTVARAPTSGAVGYKGIVTSLVCLSTGMLNFFSV